LQQNFSALSLAARALVKREYFGFMFNQEEIPRALNIVLFWEIQTMARFLSVKGRRVVVQNDISVAFKSNIMQ
jgi:hypothetical protein